jgi:glutamyl-tRNA synthetase
LEKLRAGGWIYPCHCTRQDIARALQAPHAGEEEPIYPGTCRPAHGSVFPAHNAKQTNWRFRVPEGEIVSFADGFFGSQEFQGNVDFGDFVVWRHDDTPAYQLAVVVDDAAMRVTEVVRGTDLLLSTARQLLLYHALELEPPTFYHCPLVTDETGARLAKRHDALSLRALRAKGMTPQQVREQW